jgi:hypothetical protein
VDTLDNTGHNLMTMGSLCQNHPYLVRVVARHLVLVYCIALCFLWMTPTSLSYRFYELRETHAVDTCGQFVDENEDALKALPPSLTVLEYIWRV